MPEFVIGYWCGPPSSFVSSASFDQISKCGFTLAMPACNELYDVSHVKNFVAAADAAKIPALIADDRISNPSSFDHLPDRADAVAADWKKTSGVLGYYLADEPDPKSNPKIFDFLGEIVAELRIKDPTRLTYVNLLPLGYGPYTDEKDYVDYVEGCIAKVNSHILSFDHYPSDSQAGRAGFSRNLRVVRDVCAAHGQPFWAFVDAFPPLPSGKPVPGSSVDHLRWQVMEAVRYGASGVMYFTYWTPPTREFDGTGAMVARDGTLTSRYDEVKQINDDLRAVTGRTGEVLFGRVRATTAVPAGEGDLWLLDSSDPKTGQGSTTARRLAGEGWDWMNLTMPGYGLVNARDKDVNGFWLSARNDLLGRTFYVLNVVGNGGRLYKVTRGGIVDMGSAGWADAHGSHKLGMFFDQDGFWVSIE